LEVRVQHDRYARETSWTLEDAAGQIVASVQSTDEQKNRLVTTTLSLPSGFYLFTIFDTWRDGLCCGFGPGFYSVVVKGEQAFGGGDFNAESEATYFFLDENGNVLNGL